MSIPFPAHASHLPRFQAPMDPGCPSSLTSRQGHATIKRTSSAGNPGLTDKRTTPRSLNGPSKTWCYLLCGCRSVWVTAPHFPSWTQMLLCHMQPLRTLKSNKNLSLSYFQDPFAFVGFYKTPSSSSSYFYQAVFLTCFPPLT